VGAIVTWTSERPTRTETGAYDRYREEHPSYALIGASRVSSHPGEYLFGSDFRHDAFIVVSIHRAELTRGLSQDRVHATRDPEVVSIALSAAQWATFVSSMNVGHGVPATLQRVAGQMVPSIAPPETTRRDQLQDEISEHMTDAIASLTELRDAAPTRKLRAMAERAIQQLTANLPFISEQFDEHAEQTVERAKMEVNAYVQDAIGRAGLTALAGVASPIELETGDETDG
jgi:hypothetical protein